MGTRHPVEGHRDNEFPTICNHAELWRSEVARCLNFVSNFCFCCLEKTTPCGKIFKIMFRKFSPPHRSTLLCLNVVEYVRRKMVEMVRYLPDQKHRIWLLLKLSLLRGSRPKYARASLKQCAHKVLQISSKSVHFQRSYSRTHEQRFFTHIVFPVFAQLNVLCHSLAYNCKIERFYIGLS